MSPEIEKFKKESKRIVVEIIHDGTIDVCEGVNKVKSNKCGAISMFLGNVRDQEQPVTNVVGTIENSVKAIYYEAYEPMLVNQVFEIVRRVVHDKSVNNINISSARSTSAPVRDSEARVYVCFRMGLVHVGQAAVGIFMSSARREPSHSGVMTILEKIKAKVPIWKKIIYVDGREDWASLDKSEAAWLRTSDL